MLNVAGDDKTIWSSSENAIVVYSLLTNKCLKVTKTSYTITSLVCHKNVIVACSDDSFVRVWDINVGPFGE